MMTAQELYATLTRGRHLNFDPAEARQIVVALSVWKPTPIDLSILQ